MRESFLDQFYQLEAMKDPITPIYIVGAVAFVSVISLMWISLSWMLWPQKQWREAPGQGMCFWSAAKVQVMPSIGAEHVRLACVNLMRASDQKQKQNFLQALNWTKTEFARTRNKLQVIVQMERRIMRLEAKQRQYNAA
ncbi:uncharacterized protein LOC120211983 isoform X1 [Hibiscus syriacus]|uniref:uncharacterized protein LOC120211983 isoform X1 n=1 Tax=Hibiscus syriacus TaxID=106335 RepID=UPI0019229D2D|nr:uncharacterized protein LOC120211983 isoform X1 [Hibiscus syriacus]